MADATPLKIKPGTDGPTDVDLVADFLRHHIQRKQGARVAVGVLYEWYADFWGDYGSGSKPLTAREFGVALREICERLRIRVRHRKGHTFCCGVRLIDPDMKVLAGPAGAEASRA